VLDAVANAPEASDRAFGESTFAEVCSTVKLG
jgi:hypothetical protein